MTKELKRRVIESLKSKTIEQVDKIYEKELIEEFKNGELSNYLLETEGIDTGEQKYIDVVFEYLESDEFNDTVISYLTQIKGLNNE